jgi:hypothetical protein
MYYEIRRAEACVNLSVVPIRVVVYYCTTYYLCGLRLAFFAPDLDPTEHFRKRVCLLLQYLLQSCSRGGGGGKWRTCATRYDEPRFVWTSLTITHKAENFLQGSNPGQMVCTSYQLSYQDIGSRYFNTGCVRLFSLVPLLWESNPKLQGGWCKTNLPAGIWSPPRALQLCRIN